MLVYQRVTWYDDDDDAVNPTDVESNVGFSLFVCWTSCTTPTKILRASLQRQWVDVWYCWTTKKLFRFSMTIDVPTYKTQADSKVKIFPLPCWLIPRAGIGRGCHLTRQDKAVLWHNYKKYIWQKEKKQTQKTKKKWNDRKRHKPCKGLWLVALEMPSEIGQS